MRTEAFPPTEDRPRSVTILGVTGSIGASTVDLVLQAPACYRVEAVTAQSRVDALAEAALALRARLAVIGESGRLPDLRERLAGSGIEAAGGADALVEAAARPVDWTMAAIVGAAGLAPTMAAIGNGRMVALANKECLVCAGPLLMRAVEASGTALLPVDSEHNAIFQCLAAARLDEVDRLILTASGGPFRAATLDAMRQATPAEAVRHPNWRMGAKISVDSATLMNKGLELIEAHHLFAMPEPLIEVLVHPQSVVHSLVAFKDGSLLAQLGPSDMRVPIAHALGWPGRLRTDHPKLDLAAIARLDFAPPDTGRFPALALARAALRQGGAAPTMLNAANEVAVDAFLAGEIGFLDIAAVVGRVLDGEPPCRIDTLDAVLEVDARARAAARRHLDHRPLVGTQR
ncbi:MAG: 1-deoxy-D-xylulose-5-phosphate reductoisomerase [Geminicoccaceae bacterium]|nr:1-deoxy-D-xylulose-5-phosphate reductoisomerase [Geminicoccaceae bacterium]